ncbi:hypothetical protein NHX12_021903 [Muraenolepis orangiensis]|uniref:Actinodin1 n=1 Tax=Muraenolepis orangiensis TaxID=630683 RepID=A0A9Q0IVJ4_9TELE|nr:hypothetical protein NHX12_021903 [Muraenolepis orangiensis]
MAGRRRMAVFSMFLTGLVAALLMPAGGSLQERAAEQASSRQLVRQRRNISWYKQNADFWSWYKYFTDNGNQEAVQELDRIYLAYLQNKNRAEGRRSYKAYLSHLGDIYKSCADSDDPKCVESYTTRPKPEPPKPAPVKTCDPTKDAHCLYAALLQGKSPYLPLVLPATKAAAAPAAPSPVYARAAAAPAKDPRSGYYYYSPSVQPFLTKEQKAELLRICSAEDVECLQYHLKAAFGYKPAAGPLPSYAHLGCDPKTDRSCQPQLVQKAPSGVYLKYPNCDPLKDPRCAYAASLSAPRAPNPPAHAGPGSCNPLLEEGCNPLTATKFASPPEEFQDEQKGAHAAAIRAAPAPAEQRNDPYAMFRNAFAHAHGARDPYAMYRQAGSQPAAQANDPYAMYRQASSQSAAQANDPYAMYRQASSQSAAQANDPYAMYRQASSQSAAQANDPYAMYRQASSQSAAQANDPYAMYRQAGSQASDPYSAMLRQLMPQAPSRHAQGGRHNPYEQPSQEQHHPVGPSANDPYATYRQASNQASDSDSDTLRQLMSQAMSNDPYAPSMGAAPEADANDPFAAFREASRRAQGPYAARQDPFQQPAQEHNPLGPPGKTKEGYDCFIGYDLECYPVKPTDPRTGPHSRPHPAEPYEPHLNADGSRNGVMEPSNPDCDPEFDHDCRLRRFEPQQEATEAQPEQQEQHLEEEEDSYHQGATESDSEPYQSGQEEPYMPFPQQQAPQGMPSFQDMLRGYGDQFPERGDHRAYADDYRKK